MPERVLVAWASRYGTSARIAERVAALAESLGHAVVRRDLAVDDHLDDDCTMVIAVGAVYSNQHDDQLVKALQRWVPSLRDRTTALVSISLAAALGSDAGEAMMLDYVDELAQLTGFNPKQVALVAGSLDESRYDGPTRALLNIAHWRTGLDVPPGGGDVSFTDGPALDRVVKRWFGSRR